MLKTRTTKLHRKIAKPRPSAKVLRVLKRLADEDRTPARWINGTDDPTTPA